MCAWAELWAGSVLGGRILSEPRPTEGGDRFCCTIQQQIHLRLEICKRKALGFVMSLKWFVRMCLSLESFNISDRLICGIYLRFFFKCFKIVMRLRSFFEDVFLVQTMIEFFRR